MVAIDKEDMKEFSRIKDFCLKEFQKVFPNQVYLQHEGTYVLLPSVVQSVYAKINKIINLKI
mgnify:CR=1 FL=1